MTLPPNNRMANPLNRGQGRPPKTDEPTPKAVPVVVDTTQRHVPPIANPPCCGRGMVPKVERWEVSGTHAGSAACICTLCGGRFYYRPATVRAK